MSHTAADAFAYCVVRKMNVGNAAHSDSLLRFMVLMQIVVLGYTAGFCDV